MRSVTVICLSAALVAGAGCHGLQAQAGRSGVIPQLLELHGDLSVHDPVMIREGSTYYVFSTGRNRGGPGVIPIRCSNDMINWRLCGYVFERLPDWARQEITRNRGDAWAPDISYFNGRYHLYYSVSSFGRNDSAIGLATNVTLDPNSPNYRWVDQGMVIRSHEGKDDWNAIDPQLVVEGRDKVWLCWGSFWSGIKMCRIDPKTGKPSSQDTTLYSLASRPRQGPDQTPPQQGAIEAPFIVKHGRWWYLFVSFDFCCRGTRSTYYVVVGRSNRITGPYVDRQGRPMLEGGGTVVVEATTPNWRGPGHQAVYRDRTGDYLVFHAYHGQTGRSELKISPIIWADGWPRAGSLP